MSLLRLATSADCELVWRLNNEPTTRAISLSQKAIPWEVHETWFAAKLDDPGNRMWIVCEAGVVRLDRSVISIALAPELRGKGVGSRAISEACADVEFSVYAWIFDGNSASVRAFTKAGFVWRETRVVEERSFGVYCFTPSPPAIA